MEQTCFVMSLIFHDPTAGNEQFQVTVEYELRKQVVNTEIRKLLCNQSNSCFTI